MPHCRRLLSAIVLLIAIAAVAPTAVADELSLKGLQIRGRVLAILPDESADISTIGGDVDITNTVVPEIDFSYFFNKYIALELIAAITPHDVEATGTSLGNVDLGSVWLLPPTLLLQYHHPFANGLKPYVGAGVNYTFFLNEDAAGGTVTSVDYENSFGWALQFGVDYMLTEHWLLNLDVKKLFLSTDVSLNGGAIKADVDIDPWIIGVGLGYRF